MKRKELNTARAPDSERYVRKVGKKKKIIQKSDVLEKKEKFGKKSPGKVGKDFHEFVSESLSIKLRNKTKKYKEMASLT
jgi:hypothetical protein